MSGQDGGIEKVFRLEDSPPPLVPGLTLESPDEEEEEDSIQYYYDRGDFEEAEAEAKTRQKKGENVDLWFHKIGGPKGILEEIEKFRLDEPGSPMVPLKTVELKCQELARIMEGYAAIVWANQIVQRVPLQWLTKKYPAGFSLGSDVFVGRVIGRGGTCVVFEVQRPDAFPRIPGEVDRKVACKKLEPMNQRDYNFDFRNEIDILDYLNDSGIMHVVSYVGEFSNALEPCILISPVAQVDLAMYLAIDVERQNPGDWERSLQIRDQLFNWTLCLSRTLAELHAQDILHRDIRPANILVWYSDDRNNNKIMFADFGLAFRAGGGGLVPEERQMQLGDFYYAAPEIQHLYDQDGVGASGKSGDVFALGCVFYEMLEAWLHASAKKTARLISMVPHELPTVPKNGRYGHSSQDLEFVRQARTMKVKWNFLMDRDSMRSGSVERLIEIVFDMMMSTPRSTAAEVAVAVREMMERFNLFPSCGRCS